MNIYNLKISTVGAVPPRRYVPFCNLSEFFHGRRAGKDHRTVGVARVTSNGSSLLVSHRWGGDPLIRLNPDGTTVLLRVPDELWENSLVSTVMGLSSYRRLRANIKEKFYFVVYAKSGDSFTRERTPLRAGLTTRNGIVDVSTIDTRLTKRTVIKGANDEFRKRYNEIAPAISAMVRLSPIDDFRGSYCDAIDSFIAGEPDLDSIVVLGRAHTVTRWYHKRTNPNYEAEHKKRVLANCRRVLRENFLKQTGGFMWQK